jgi:ABC-type uncharacterized transport system auxiliary subunit
VTRIERMPSGFRVLLSLAIAGSALLSACGAARPITYYSLNPPAVTPASQRLDVSLLVGHVTAPSVYRESRILYRTGPNSMGTYEDNRWVEPPPSMCEEMLLDTLRRSHRYRSVQELGSNARGDYLIRGRLERFEQVEGSPLQARVWLRLSLYDPKSGNTVWSNTYEQDEPVAEKDLASVVSALNQNLQRAVLQLTSEIDQYLAAHPAPPAPAAEK